ncbi:MAG: recombinase family protein, partial [Elusimicrobiota bacterium]|nr:recombinase family protein [Elusimicrobiota bacterium]
TEDEDRQVMSIEAQIVELHEYAKRENLEIAEEFVESKSAKSPGREIFNKMIEKVKSNPEPVGLLAWHPDRLARNSVDGGQIIYLIDTGKIVSLKFPTFWFEPTPQGLFMLQVAFGQSKYYSDNLSENVKRGIRQKLRRGEWPHCAPIGYINDRNTKNIVPHPLKARIIRKAFEEFATGRHTLESLGNWLKLHGIESRNRTPLCRATIQRILTNQAYIGVIVYKGEIYEGNYEPIVSRATFEAVQKILKNRSKPRKSKIRHDFPFVGLLRCGECGAAITAQYAHGNGGTYRYYRCTKRLRHCSQRYLREDLLVEQLREWLSKVALCDDLAKVMLAQVEIWQNKNIKSSQIFAKNLNRKLEKINQKLDKLVSGYLDGIIEKEIYLQKKDELTRQKIDLQQKKANFWRKENNWIEPLKSWILEANSVEKIISSNDFYQMKSLVEKIGTNRLLLNKQIFWDWKEPYKILVGKLNSRQNVPPSAEQKFISKNQLVSIGRGDWI